MTYRASLGTRGELRRIAAEAEIAAIERVRPWIRQVQKCKLAPHVIVPQWSRLEHPVEAKAPPPLASDARIISGELLEEILEAACAKKFRRGRPRRGRPRRRTESEPDVEMADAPEGSLSETPAASPVADSIIPSATPSGDTPIDILGDNPVRITVEASSAPQPEQITAESSPDAAPDSAEIGAATNTPADSGMEDIGMQETGPQEKPETHMDDVKPVEIEVNTLDPQPEEEVDEIQPNIPIS